MLSDQGLCHSRHCLYDTTMSRDDSLPLPQSVALSVRTTERGSVLVASLTGESCLGLWKAIESQLTPDLIGVVVELGKAPFLDSVNIAAIISTRNQVTGVGKRFSVASLSPNIQAVFRILKLDRMFELGFDLDRAVAAVSA